MRLPTGKRVLLNHKRECRLQRSLTWNEISVFQVQSDDLASLQIGMACFRYPPSASHFHLGFGGPRSGIFGHFCSAIGNCSEQKVYGFDRFLFAYLFSLRSLFTIPHQFHCNITGKQYENVCRCQSTGNLLRRN